MLLYLFNTALTMWRMTFQRHNHVKEWEWGVPPDPEGMSDYYLIRLNCPISVKRGFNLRLKPCKNFKTSKTKTQCCTNIPVRLNSSSSFSKCRGLDSPELVQCFCSSNLKTKNIFMLSINILATVLAIYFSIDSEQQNNKFSGVFFNSKQFVIVF